MKKSNISVALFLLMSSHNSVMALPLNDNYLLETNLAITSNYLSNGASVTHGKPALQLTSFLFHVPTGLYGGIWGTNFDVGAPADREIGGYIEINKYFSEKFSIDTSIGKFLYEDYSALNTIESNTKISYDKFYVNYIYDWLKSPLPDAEFRYLGFKSELPKSFWIDAAVGFHDLHSRDLDPILDGKYNSYSLTVGKHVNENIDTSFMFSNTNLNDFDCAYASGYAGQCGSTLVITLDYKF